MPTRAPSPHPAAPTARGLSWVPLLVAAGCVGPSEEELPATGEFNKLLAGGRPVTAVETNSDGELAGDTASDDAEWEALLSEMGIGGDDEEPPGVSENPYVAFGSRIIVHDNGLITKPYPLPLGKADRIVQLMNLYATFDVDVVASDAPQRTAPEETRVMAEILPQWDLEYYTDLRQDQKAKAANVELADWLVITTGQELLHEVEAFINLFLAEIPQVEIEAKIVEVIESEELEIGVGELAISPTEDTPVAVFPSNTFVDNVSFDFPITAPESAGLLTLGAVQDGVAYNFILQAVETMDNVEISSMPKIAVREGARAEILNTQDIPTLNVTGINQAGNYSASLQFKEVGVKLYVLPRLVGTDTVALYIDIEASQQVGEQTFFVSQGTGVGAATTALPAPVIANRKAKTVVYLKPGEGVILGGLTTERTVESVRRVPILGSIPILGLLFRRTLDRTERTSVLFFLRPRVLQGIDLQRDF